MKRKCERCGVNLSDDDVMKIKIDEGEWVQLPLPVCPHCFTERMRELAAGQNKS